MQEADHHGDRWFKDSVEQSERRAALDYTFQQLKAAARTAGTPLGKTGDYPHGAMTPDDEGGLNMAVTAQHGKVIVAFGKPVQWIGLNPNEARSLAKLLGEYADNA